MDGGGNGLSVQPLVPAGAFNWVFLVEVLVCGILALFFLFYFNRLFATVIAYCIRAWTWHQYRAYIDISALQISLLGGRIFFKSIRYHAHNVTVLVYEGHITWRYWLRLVQEAEVFDDEGSSRKRKSSSPGSDGHKQGNIGEKTASRSRSIGKEEKAGGKPKKELPCRISVKVAGVEAFVYNRSPVYDMVMEQTRKKAQPPQSSSGSDEKQPSRGASSSSEVPNEKRTDSFRYRPRKINTQDTTGLASVAQTVSHDEPEKPKIPSFLRMFPIRVECRKAAAAIGNENTTSVVVAKLAKATGTVDAGHAGPFDLYKLLFGFDLENINVTMKPNRDFKQLQRDAARRVIRDKETAAPQRLGALSRLVSKLRKRFRAFGSLFSTNKSVNGSLRTASVVSKVDGAGDFHDGVPGQAQWHGLARYLDDKDLNEHDEWKDVEYAKASTLADIEKLHFKFYFDMPGVVPDMMPDNRSSSYAQDMNGSKPPDYGMEFGVHGGVVTYGPWTDRQRLNLQQIFFPASYVDATPAEALQPGATRNWSLFNILVVVEEDVTLRIPSREPSKDEKWQGRAAKSRNQEQEDGGPTKGKRRHGRKGRHGWRQKRKQGNPGIDARPYAWLDVTVKTDSTVKYTMDMFSRVEGYVNKLDCDIKGTEITSSVNHGLLWRTGAVALTADLSQAACWNSLRKWPFDIRIDDLELFILRDHMFLIIDLVNDWSYGPPSDFYTFVPYIYNLHMLFNNFIIYLNVNDANIVNDPADLEKNDFLTLEGVLDATLDINMDKFRPVRNFIAYDVLATNMRMRMLSPTRSTINTFLQDKLVADLPKLTLSGSYSGHLEEKPGLTDTLRFDIVGTGLTLKAYGFLVRLLINVKENYFGDYMHFKTLEEFQAADEDLTVANVKTASLPKPASINELDVMLCIIAEDVTVLLPTNIYSCHEFVRAELPVANLDLRIVSYYLDMGLQLSPVTILSGSSSSEDESPVESASSAQMFCKYVDLDGHRAFGLPPDEPAYVNQWNIDIGKISGDFSSSFVHDLAIAGRAFIFGFQDRENALPLPSPSVFFDVTFVQVRTDTVRIWLHVGKDAILLSLDPVEVVTNDWAGDTFSQRISVLAQKVTLACVDAKSALRHRGREADASSPMIPAKTYAFLQTGVAVNVVMRKLHFEDERRKQQAHIRENDLRTHRARFLQRQYSVGAIATTDGAPDVTPAAMPFPFLAPPMNGTGGISQCQASIHSSGNERRRMELHAKGSSGSLSTSIKNSPAHANSRTLALQRDQTLRTPSTQSMRSSSRASSIESDDQRHTHGNGRQRSMAGLPRSTMAFTSPYSEPYFPMDLVEPDETNVPGLDRAVAGNEPPSETSSTSELNDDSEADDNTAQVSVLITVTPGIRAYVEPRVVATGAKLFRKLLPKQPEEVMDTFQMDVLGTVAADQGGQIGTNQALEIQVELPAARVRVANPVAEVVDADQAEITLANVATLVRIRDTHSAGGPQQTIAVHSTLKAFNAAVGTSSQLVAGRSPVTASLTDLLLYLALASTQTVNATLGDSVVSIAGDQADYLTDLVFRLLPVVDKLKKKLEIPPKIARERLLLLVHAVVEHGGESGDPVFLSRMIYILRAFPDHFRNADSWKILMRMRHGLDSLPKDARTELLGRNKELPTAQAMEVPAKELQDWASMRNWDVPNIHQTEAFKRILNEDAMSVMPSDSKPMVLAIRSRYIQVQVASEGKDANTLVLEDTTAGLHQIPPTAPTGLMLLDENTKTRTDFQLHTDSIRLSANWSVFTIVQRVLPVVEKLQALAAPIKPTRVHSEQQLEYGLARHVYHAVISTDHGSIALHSINLRHLSRAEGLKVSVIGTTKAEEPYGPCASAMLNAQVAITELHGPTRQIWQSHLASPSVYVDHLQSRPGTEVPPSMTAAIGYRFLDLALLEPPAGLLHMVNTVLSDEVFQVMKLISTLKPNGTPSGISKEDTAVSVASTSPKVHLALLAGDLRVQLSLLQALKYQLEGTAASVRMAPSLEHEREWNFDFDIGGQTHMFINSSSSEQHQQNILDVPPINGHVGLARESDATSLSVTAIMDRVEIEATAIQGVVGILKKPEVQSVLSAMKAGVEDIQRHVDQLMPKEISPKSPSGESGQHIAFDVRFALAGVRVAATTPLSRGNSIAEVEFGIGAVHAVASNRTTFGQRRTLMPEVRAQVREIGAKLQLTEETKQRECGKISLDVNVHFKSHFKETGKLARELKMESDGLEVNVHPDTAFVAVDVINHIQDEIRDLDLTAEIDYLRRLRDSRRSTVLPRISRKSLGSEDGEVAFSAVDLLSVKTTVELKNIRMAWIVPASYGANGSKQVSDLVLALDRIDFTTRGGREARLAIQDLQVQLVKKGTALMKRALNSALMPEVSFTVAYWSIGKSRSLAFKAAGKPLEIRLESKFILPVNAVQLSIASAVEQFKVGTATWKSTPTTSGAPRAKLLDTKLVASLLMEADFAGALVYVQGSGPRDASLSLLAASSQQHGSQHGRYGQFAADGAQMQTTLRAPGIAMKVEYHAQVDGRPSTVNGEVQVEASSNMLLPNVVPLLIEISNGVKEVMQKQNELAPPKEQPAADVKAPQRFFEDESIVTADPAAIFGKTKVDLGLRICRQEFGLTCQPIARVDAKAQMDDLYITMNTIDSEDHGRFFAISALITKLTAQVKHVYSREPTFRFDMDSINLSVLNSKHLSGTSGVSATLKINPTRTSINGKQLQDLLLFREIWMPPEIRSSQPSSPPPQQATDRPEDFFAQKYQSVAAAAAFPWNATVSIAELAVDLDLGQSIGKQSFTITDLWASQAKASNWEQNLCVGMEEMAVTATGRMSGFIRLNKLGVRTSIKWPQDVVEHRRTPLIQASAGFQRLRAKAAFDYQAFAFGDIEGFDFLMYNVHQTQGSMRDRLVAVLDCEKAFVFCTSTSPAQAVGLCQAFDRLIKEKQQAYMQSLRDIEKHLRRQSTVVPTRFGPTIPNSPSMLRSGNKTGISLHTDVVLTMGTISFGVFPSSFFDSQILKLEANNIQARFAVGLERGRIQSGLGMTLGQLQVALASVRRATAVPRALDVSVDDVVSSAVNAKGGTILRVPRVVASMQTWQDTDTNNVDYIFKSLFDGKIDVGWNLSRIDFIKNMWVTHSRSLAARLGKALPESAVKITAGPIAEDTTNKSGDHAGAQEKITAEVNLPQFRYEYHALEPPIIETPQLRDMGEATPPLEWIGLNRDRLPNVTHQIIIVSLLEVAKEVEDAYEKILGSS